MIETRRIAAMAVIAVGLVLSSAASADNVQDVLNFTRSLGGAVGCKVLSDDEGGTLLKNFEKKAPEVTDADFMKAYGEGVTFGKLGHCDLFEKHPEIGQKLRAAARQ